MKDKARRINVEISKLKANTELCTDGEEEDERDSELIHYEKPGCYF